MGNNEMIVAIVSAVLGSSFLTTALNLISEKLNKNSAKNQGLRFLLVDNILTKGTEYVGKGYVTQLEWQIFDGQYKSYKKLGGDGYADKMYEAVNKLVPEEIQNLQKNVKAEIKPTTGF